jgi:hypothetical protein
MRSGMFVQTAGTQAVPVAMVSTKSQLTSPNLLAATRARTLATATRVARRQLPKASQELCPVLSVRFRPIKRAASC